MRWKGRQGDRPTASSLEFAVEMNHVPWSCLRTTQPWGPDDEPVEPQRCQPGRDCFRPDDGFDPTC